MHHLRSMAVRGVLAWALLSCVAIGAFAADADFLDAKTIFQTNAGYDPRIAIAADGVIVHRHGGAFAGELASWREKGFTVGRMFFADSDAANAYWTGRWDGVPHPNDVERNQAGEVVKCAGVRPYMLPTDGWIRYLEEMADQSLDAGATAILPEEPLAHVFTGYEDSFRKLWAQRYGKPWAPQHSSAEARFLTAQLKNELYIELERRLSERAGQFGRDHDREIGFVLPIHSLYSNIAAQLVAPLGTSVDLPGIDGYIGQIWTGPVNWALGCYGSSRKSFFTSAYVLYDYFTQLTVASDRKLWLLVDPVEDNPDHTWAAFAQWYKHCIAAMLLMDEVDSYEIMPWPDRIFLPGHSTGGSTPAPEDYRVTILAVTQALQEMPLGGRRFVNTWPSGAVEGAMPSRIGVAMADTLMWQKHEHPMLQGVYALFLPLLERGVPVSSFVMERAKEAAYMSRFDTIVLSYEDFKPLDRAMHTALVDWVKGGGVLLVLGRDGDALDACEDFWWHKRCADSPLAHLLNELQAPAPGKGQWHLGKGWVIRDEISPRRFTDPKVAQSTYLRLIGQALSKANGAAAPQTGSFCMQRGPFVVAHAETESLSLHGRLLDVFDPQLTLRKAVELQPGESGLYRDVAPLVKAGKPALLHATHRVMSCQREGKTLTFTLRGPAKTPGVARVFFSEANSAQVKATAVNGGPVDVTSRAAGDTLLVSFPNAPEGVTVQIK